MFDSSPFMNDNYETDKTFPDYMFDKGVEMWRRWKMRWPNLAVNDCEFGEIFYKSQTFHTHYYWSIFSHQKEKIWLIFCVCHFFSNLMIYNNK